VSLGWQIIITVLGHILALSEKSVITSLLCKFL